MMLGWWLAALMAGQATLGLVWPEHYRDTGYVAGTWFGNDLVTLVLASPTLVTGILLEGRGSGIGVLLRFGALGYAVYNYAFYLLGATLNPLFPLYAVTLVLAGSALILALADVDPQALLGEGGVKPRDRWVGGFMTVVATGLALVWLVMWAAHVFAGSPVPGDDPDAFRLVAALDLTLIVPVLGCGGVLLWRRSSWGFVITALAGVQATLYLTVLTLNAGLFIRRGLVEPPGELPVWGGLAVAIGAATAVLLAGVRGQAQPPLRY